MERWPGTRKCKALRPAPVLLSESSEELSELYQRFQRELEPRDAIENMYVVELTNLCWQILLLSRCKTGIINVAYKEVVRELLNLSLASADENPFPSSSPMHTVQEAYRRYQAKLKEKLVENKLAQSIEEAEALACRWQLDDDAKATAKLLNIEEYFIEAEAVRRAAVDIERIDRMLTTLELRRNRALGGLAEYREMLAPTLRQGCDPVTRRKSRPQLAP
jgi:hypothetical protein